MRKGDSWKQSWKMPFLRTLVMEQKWACLQGFLPEPWMQYSKPAQGSCVWAGSEGPGQFPVLLSLGQAATFGGFCVKCTLWAWLFPYLLTGLSIPSEHPLEGSEFLSVLGVRSLVLLENGTFLLWGWFSTELSLILVLATIITSSTFHLGQLLLCLRMGVTAAFILCCVKAKQAPFSSEEPSSQLATQLPS